MNGQPIRVCAATLDDASKLYLAAEKAATEPKKTTGQRLAEQFLISTEVGMHGRRTWALRSSLSTGWGTYFFNIHEDANIDLVRQHIARWVDSAIAEEREACRAIAQSHANFGSSPYENGFRHAAEVIEQEIRNRK